MTNHPSHSSVGHDVRDGAASPAVLPPADLENDIIRYWDARAEGFGRSSHTELAGDGRRRWTAELAAVLSCGARTLDILDAGCGSGFFSILAAGFGHRVTGVDLTPAMIDQARTAAARLGVDATFEVMDAQALDFADASFNVVLTRNLTWTLPDVPAAYREWFRVLRTEGRLVNFDADYGAVSFAGVDTELRNKGVASAHDGLELATLAECDRIKDRLAVSSRRRPDWDRQLLEDIGYKSVAIDAGLSDRIYPALDGACNPVRMFRIDALKI